VTQRDNIIVRVRPLAPRLKRTTRTLEVEIGGWQLFIDDCRDHDAECSSTSRPSRITNREMNVRGPTHRGQSFSIHK
jgi:hypothetical protein